MFWNNNLNPEYHEKYVFGNYYFEVGITMIESMLLGSTLTNIEVAYNK